jgi:hypothetical protein
LVLGKSFFLNLQIQLVEFVNLAKKDAAEAINAIEFRKLFDNGGYLA